MKQQSYSFNKIAILWLFVFFPNNLVLLAERPAMAQINQYSNHVEFRKEWQQEVIRYVEKGNGNVVALAILTSAGWADRGQLIVLTNKATNQVDVYYVYTGVSLLKFRAGKSEYDKNPKAKPKKFLHFRVSSDALPDAFSNLATAKSFHRSGLDHLKYFILEADVDNSKLLKYRTSFFDSPMLKKDAPKIFGWIQEIFKWVDSKKED